MPPRVAAVTMAFDETQLLPIWCRHYQRQVGADHCYVIDHGSSERVLVTPGVNILRIPRSPHDDERRARFVSSFVGGLLQYYDWVVQTDVDELVLADPGQYPNLPALCASAACDTVTAIGFDVQHVPSLEAELDPFQSVGLQRSWVRFTSAMCKPILTRRPLVWAPGFHNADAPLQFDNLYLFHLHWADRVIGLQRLKKTRLMPWGPNPGGSHQRVSDSNWISTFDGMATFPRVTLERLAPDVEPLKGWLKRTQASWSNGSGNIIDLHINAPELWGIPDRFRSRL